ncbi:hypothetical protein [Flavobacterium chungangense]|uniref:Uncharacterized protein n=1 Tax=Flavobacterium chungangense TaxID=554283 RepID=A0A6V6Z8K2_9FLAO|nr:hypothetical protein [Flavobacterium chungangense]CAD0007846.1 hypothetical protein FLACHUCJ7_03496 [Flavobacterium chungangense]
MENQTEIKAKEIITLLKGLTLKEAKEILRKVEADIYQSVKIN